MSFSFCPFYKLLLSDEIRHNIKIKIEIIKVNGDWCDFDLSIKADDLNLSTMDCEVIKQQRNIWRIIAKVSIDLWTDYEYYQRFILVSNNENKEYEERLISLGYVCSDGQWKSVNKPSEDIVQTNVFVYLLHQLMYKKMNESDILCAFCDVKFVNRQCKCFCGASYDEIKTLRKKLFKNNDPLEAICSGGPVDKHNGCSHWQNDNETMSMISRVNKMKKKEYSLGKGDCGMFEAKELSELFDVNKWKCGKCGYVNDYTFINCFTCEGLYKDGKWICGHCTMENGCKSDKCSACGEMNVNVKIDIKETVQKSKIITNNDATNKPLIKDDQWKCAKCSLFQSYELNNCLNCEDNRSICGEWSCIKCSFINKCAVDKCTVCHTFNNHVIVKYCQYCKKTKLSNDAQHGCTDCSDRNEHRNNRWQCWYDNCRTVNVGEDQYCQRCKLWRHNSTKRGDRCAQWYQGGVRYVWMCHRCYTANESSRLSCSRFFCHETRYKKTFCFKCNVSSNGTLNYCQKCHQML